MKKNVTILLATYNGEKFVEEQIDSILKQTYTNWELFIHDDGSNDNTVKILENLSKKYQDKIFLIKDDVKFGNPKDNFIHILNKIPLQKFDYFMFCDQDDAWLPEKVEKSVKKITNLEKEHSTDIPILVHTDLKVADKDLNIISESLWKSQKLDPGKKSINYLLVQNNITGCTMIFNKKLAKMSLKIGKKAIMHDWWMTLIASSFGKIDFIPEQLILYRQHGKNDTGAKIVNLNYSLKKAARKEEIISSLRKTFLQSQGFYNLFKKSLPPNIRKIVKAYTKIPYMNYPIKIKTLLKYKFLKQNFSRNIGLLIYIKDITGEIYDNSDNSNI